MIELVRKRDPLYSAIFCNACVNNQYNYFQDKGLMVLKFGQKPYIKSITLCHKCRKELRQILNELSWEDIDA